MNKEDYKKIIKNNIPKESRIKDAFIAFFSGGMLGLILQLFSKLLIVIFAIKEQSSYMICTLFLIGLTTFLTGIGVFDNLVKKFKCGLIVPTTGFAHSVAASLIDYKRDGLINGVGANCFRLAGSVILYGFVSAFFFCILKVVIIHV